MKFTVMLRDGSTGQCRIGDALTGGDAAVASSAKVSFAGEPIAPNNGLIVILRVGAEGTAILDLIEAGYAVQVRDSYWRPEA